MEEELALAFNGAVFNKVIDIRTNLEKKKQIAPSLRTLCLLHIDYLVLDCSMIETTISKLCQKVGKKYKPICQYLLRRWEQVNQMKLLDKPECTKNKLKKQKKKKVEKVYAPKQASLYRIEKAVDKKMYLTNSRRENKDTSTLFGLCKAKIEGIVKDSLLKKKTLEPLVTKISGDALKRCEQQVPEITEFSEILWRLLIFRDFMGLKLSDDAINNYPREFYFHLLRQKLVVVPFIQSLRIPRLRPHWVLPDPCNASGESQEPSEIRNVCFKALVVRILVQICEKC